MSLRRDVFQRTGNRVWLYQFTRVKVTQWSAFHAEFIELVVRCASTTVCAKTQLAIPQYVLRNIKISVVCDDQMSILLCRSWIPLTCSPLTLRTVICVCAIKERSLWRSFWENCWDSIRSCRRIDATCPANWSQHRSFCHFWAASQYYVCRCSILLQTE